MIVGESPILGMTAEVVDGDDGPKGTVDRSDASHAAIFGLVRIDQDMSRQLAGRGLMREHRSQGLLLAGADVLDIQIQSPNDGLGPVAGPHRAIIRIRAMHLVIIQRASREAERRDVTLDGLFGSGIPRLQEGLIRGTEIRIIAGVKEQGFVQSFLAVAV